MKLIGRKEEQNTLSSCIQSNKPEFLVVYGRRRVGKTFLISEYFNHKFSFYISGVNNKSCSIQLKNFNSALNEYGLEHKESIKDWFEAFSLLKKLIDTDKLYREPINNKVIIFLDEIPWLDTKRSDFKAALDLFWNTYASLRDDLIFIVCGSATSWIMKNMVKDQGGFYNRITRKIHLLPFNLKECELYSKYLDLNYNYQQIVDCYMVFGGIPYYWCLLDKSLSLAQNIDLLCFKENGQLHDEYQALFKSLFSEKGKHRDIVEALMKKNMGLQRKDLASIPTIGDGKALTETLEELLECGFIRAYDNYKTSKNGKFFRLIDPFVLFSKTFLLDLKYDCFSSVVNTPKYYSWAGYSFEIVCLNNIDLIKRTLGISGIISREYSWKSKESNPGAQIDLLIHRNDNVINLCEIKCSTSEYVITKDYEAILRNKLDSFKGEMKPKEQLVLTFISFNGLKENSYSNIINKKINGEQLFE